SGGGDSEALRGRDIAQTENCKFAANDDNHHPCGNQVHVNQSDEGGGNQELVGDGVEQNSEGGDLKAAAGEVSIGPIGGGGGKQDEHTEKLKAHVKSPQLD